MVLFVAHPAIVVVRNNILYAVGTPTLVVLCNIQYAVSLERLKPIAVLRLHLFALDHNVVAPSIQMSNQCWEK
jgi:hypothetical protein